MFSRPRTASHSPTTGEAARKYERHAEHLRDRRRDRLARRLHDTSLQTLIALTYLVEVGDATPDELLVLLRQATDELGGAIAWLMLPPPSGARLPAALGLLSTQMGGSGLLNIEVSTRGDLAAVSPGAAQAMYLIAQEAVANAAALPLTVKVTMAVAVNQRAGTATLEVADNGPGFDVAASSGTGLGLPMMSLYAREADGTVSVHSARGAGTTVRAVLPLVALVPAS